MILGCVTGTVNANRYSPVTIVLYSHHEMDLGKWDNWTNQLFLGVFLAPNTMLGEILTSPLCATSAKGGISIHVESLWPLRLPCTKQNILVA